jgi:hypothetical protein
VEEEPDVPVPDLIVALKDADEVTDEVYTNTKMPRDSALQHYAAVKRRKFGQALNTNNAAHITIPEQMRS